MSWKNIHDHFFLSRNLTCITSLVSLFIALLLVSIKIWGWVHTPSMALLTSTVDALIDVLASIVTLVGVYYAQRPTDRGHRYGYGKAESISVFVQALLLMGAGMILTIESAGRFISPYPLSSQGIGIPIIIGSTICTTLLVVLQTLVVRYTGSTAIAADRAHYVTDIILNIVVLLALLLETLLEWTRADAIGALLISCYMVWNATIMLKLALLQLLDREVSTLDRQRITAAALSCPGVEGVHDLRTRKGGNRLFVELHVEVHGQLTIDDGHDICNKAETAVRALFTAVEVSVHLEPAGIVDDRLDDQIK